MHCIIVVGHCCDTMRQVAHDHDCLIVCVQSFATVDRSRRIILNIWLDVDDVLPQFDDRWEAFPPRLRRNEPFTPRAANLPIGNAREFAKKTLFEVWVEMFGKTVELTMHYTNKRGAVKHGAQWIMLDWEKFLQFHCCLLRMAIARRGDIKGEIRTNVEGI